MFPQPQQVQNPSLTSATNGLASMPSLTPLPIPPPQATVPGQFLYKNYLQEYTQKSSMPLPTYQTINEGISNAPMFRSTVWVSEEKFTSPNTFSHRKTAEQDVAKLALECITKRIRGEGCLLIHEPQLLNPTPPASSAVTASAPGQLLYKNHLQEYTQKSSMPLPTYQTINEGLPHAPKFRSTVWIDEEKFTSSNTFSSRKTAEQDVAKLALECITKRTRDEGCPLLDEDTIFCKLILNEFAVKIGLEKPTYSCTVQPKGLLSGFESSLVFNGVTYTGESGKSKKEAEQLAARAVILSLANSGFVTALSEIIRSKRKLLKHEPPEVLVSEKKEVEAVFFNNIAAIDANSPASGVHLHYHEFKILKPETSPEAINIPSSFVHPVSGQPLYTGSSSARKKRKEQEKS